MYWHWFKSGCALALCFLLAIILVKPIGVSTQFVIFDGIVLSVFDNQLVVAETSEDNVISGYRSSNAYLNKSNGKYAKAIAEPLSYGLVFVISMFLGGFIGGHFQKKSTEKPITQLPDFHEQRFGHSRKIRYTITFFSGVIVLLGARLAGGCTSGHMMSGMLQTAVSGYTFALAAFAIAIPTAILVYRK